MKQFLSLLEQLSKCQSRPDRTGVGRRGIFGTRMEFNMADGFPLVTSRYTDFRNIKEELFWFRDGNIDNNDLSERGIKFWKAWEVSQEEFMKNLPYPIRRSGDAHFVGTVTPVNEHFFPGSIGPMYGYAWRKAPSGHHWKDAMEYVNWFFNQKYCSDLTDAIETAFAPDVCLKIYKLIGFLPRSAKSPKLTSEQRRHFESKWYERFLIAVYENGFAAIDQLWESAKILRIDPFSARNCISAWIPQWVPYNSGTYAQNVYRGKGALAPCHAFFQIFVEPDNLGNPAKVNLQLYQRSADFPVGVPYNIASYSLLLHMLARHANLEPGKFIWTGGDTHVYDNQVPIIEKHLERDIHPLCELVFKDDAPIDLFLLKPEDVTVQGYSHSGELKYPVAS